MHFEGIKKLLRRSISRFIDGVGSSCSPSAPSRVAGKLKWKARAQRVVLREEECPSPPKLDKKNIAFWFRLVFCTVCMAVSVGTNFVRLRGPCVKHSFRLHCSATSATSLWKVAKLSASIQCCRKLLRVQVLHNFPSPGCTLLPHLLCNDHLQIIQQSISDFDSAMSFPASELEYLKSIKGSNQSHQWATTCEPLRNAIGLMKWVGVILDKDLLPQKHVGSRTNSPIIVR